MQNSSPVEPVRPKWGWLLGCTVVWAVAANGLWPQLALGAGWMSHRRPTLPSVVGSAFLILVAEGLLEAPELICTLIRTAVCLLTSSSRCLLGRSGLASCKELRAVVAPQDLRSR